MASGAQNHAVRGWPPTPSLLFPSWRGESAPRRVSLVHPIFCVRWSILLCSEAMQRRSWTPWWNFPRIETIEFQCLSPWPLPGLSLIDFTWLVLFGTIIALDYISKCLYIPIIHFQLDYSPRPCPVGHFISSTRFIFPSCTFVHLLHCNTLQFYTVTYMHF